MLVGIHSSLGQEVGNPQTLTLQQSVNRVVATDQSIQIAIQSLKESGLEPLSAYTTYAPSLTGSLSYSHTGNTSPSTIPDKGNAGLTLSQTLFDPKFGPNLRLARLSAESSRLDKSFTVREVIFGVIQSYFTVIGNQDLLKLNQETLDLANAQMKLAQTRFEAGAAARTDVLRAKVEVQNARQAVIETENNLAFTQRQLANMLNLDPKQTLTLVKPERLEFTEEAVDLIVRRSYEQREDYHAKSIAIDQEFQKKNVIIAGYAPKVTGDVSSDWTDFTSKRSDSGWSAGVGLSMPFFEGGQREIDLKASEYKIKAAELSKDKLRKSIQDEIQKAWFQTRSLRESLQALSVAVEAAEQTYRDVKAQYEAGSATSVDSLVALRDLNSTRTTFNTKTYDYQISIYNLKRASGDLKDDLSQ